MSLVSWVHLSDVHCMERDSWEFNPIATALEGDLRDFVARDLGLQPDLLFMTGDMAFGHQDANGPGSLPEQYRLFDGFLTRVRNSFPTSVPKQRVFMVPGNHDVDRKRATKALQHWLRSAKYEEIIELIRTGGGDWPQYMGRLWAYGEYLKNYNYEHLLKDPSRHVYNTKIQIGGHEVGIAGFNSSWTCCEASKDEQGRLFLGGQWQANKASEELRGTDVNIALIHHPESWFVESEKNIFFRELRKTFHFCLHGHEHDAWIQPHAKGFVKIAASACYERQGRNNGYNIVQLNPATKMARVWLRQFDNRTGYWGPLHIKGITDHDGLGIVDYATGTFVDPATQRTAVVAREKPKNETRLNRRLEGTWNTAYSYIDENGDELEHRDQIVLSSVDGRVYHGGNGTEGHHQYEVTGVLQDTYWFVGTWTSVKPGKAYHGSFVLNVPPGGETMEGKWLGTDTAPNVVTGEWTWTKAPEPLIEPKSKPSAGSAKSGKTPQVTTVVPPPSRSRGKKPGGRRGS